MLTRRHIRYHAPLVDSTAIGFTIPSCKLLERFPPQARTRLRDAGFAGHFDGRAGPQKPLNALKKATQYLAVGRLHVQRQCNHVVDHHVSRQTPFV